MRLTLRTLLAYLDDRLPPANAREIGQKINNSPFATELTERIREVKRRRRLAAPNTRQPVIEANLMAEYLDDQLTPELVARVETEILASDTMLAEVAAAHEVLGMLRDPVTVEPRLRDRLYGLDPTGATDFVRALTADAQVPKMQSSVVSEWRPLASRMVSSRKLPGVIAVALGLLWLGSVVSDGVLFGTGGSPASGADGNPSVQEEAVIADADAQPEETLETIRKAPGDADAAASSVVADAPAGATSTADAANADLAALDPGTAVPDPPLPIDELVAAADAVLPDVAKPEAGVPAAGVAVPASDVPGPAVDNNAEPAPIFLQADSRIVLSLDEQVNRWVKLSDIPGGNAVDPAPNLVDCRPLIAQRWFGIPESFEVVVSTDSAGWTATLPGAAIVRIHEGDLSGLDVLSGRLLLRADKAVAWHDQSPPRFALGTGFQTSELVLQTPDTVLGIEVMARADAPDSDSNPAVAEVRSILPMDADLLVRLTVVDGSVTLKSPGSDVETPIARGHGVSWMILDMTGFTALTPEIGPSLAALPAWLLGQGNQDVPETINLRNQLLGALSEGDDPGDAVLRLLDDRNPQAGVMAVQLLSMTRDVERLLGIVFEPRDETVHRAAIDGLSAIAMSSGSGRQAIQGWRQCSRFGFGFGRSNRGGFSRCDRQRG